MTPAEAIASQGSRLATVRAALLDATAGGNSVVQDRVSQWTTQADLWSNLGAVVLQHPDRADEWGRIGSHLADNARAIAEDAADSGTLSAIADFVEGFPAALLAVSKGTVQGARAVVKFAVDQTAGAVADVAGGASNAAASIAWGAIKAIPWPVWLVVGGVAALAAWVAVKHSGEIVGAAVKAAVP